MFTKKKYSPLQMLLWTRWEIFTFSAYATAAVVLYEVFGQTWLRLPWTPIALIGTAVAFLIGFQNNAAYGRIWEARKIWGGIVNYSRSWGIMVKDMVSNEKALEPVSEEELYDHKKRFIHRHVAWMTALRYAMRQKKSWEVLTEYATNREWHEKVFIPERDNPIKETLAPYLSKEELHYVCGKTNKATAVLTLQSNHLRELKEKGLIWEFSFLELEAILVELFNLQGKSERIKNFPYPRQYATLSYDFVRTFIMFLPFGVIPEFANIGLELKASFPTLSPLFVWFAIPFTVIVSWIFNTMHRIGTVGENPFEGSANDVPISTISRGIEIDLREMIEEDPEQIPGPFPMTHDVQM